jgi:uncharacterized MAPEG superfamily protein
MRLSPSQGDFDANSCLGLTRLRRLDIAYSVRNRGGLQLEPILTGRTAIATWRADEQQGGEWYRRAMRAHINCLENLPIYTAIVVALLAVRVTSPILDGLAITILVARICQSSIHLLLEQTNMVAGIRFAFYFLQAISMIAMGILVAISTRP